MPETSPHLSALCVFAAVPVSDLDPSIAWYARLIGRRPDHRPMPGLAEYYLAPDGDPERGTLQLVVDADRAGGGLVTINVADAHATARSLAENGIELNVDDTTSDRVRFGTVVDPEGNAITIVEPRDARGR